jgi:hypothetical protein
MTQRIARVALSALAPLVLVWLLAQAAATQAAGVVGNGTPASCTEAALASKLAGGGLVSFNCGPAAFTLVIHETQIVSHTTIDGGGRISLSGGGLNALFFVTTGVALTLDNLRIIDGYSNKIFRAAALMNAGTLVIRHSEIANGTCDSPCFAGAIINGGPLRIENSIIRGNHAAFNAGAIANLSDTVQISRSLIADNHVTGGSGGAGAINNRGATLLLRDSTLMSNTTTGDGGAIVNDALGTVAVVNSTISGNQAAENGGALSNEGMLQLYNATVTNNQADADFNGSGTGGGISNTGTFEFRNTILAGNYDTLFNFPHYNDCSGVPSGTFTSFGNNILMNYTPSKCPVAGSITLADPLLGPLYHSGGPTPTHAPLPGSPAIDQGNPSGCVDHASLPLVTDQRGFRRPVFGGSALRCDIGAVEYYRDVLALPLVVR